uniref:Uncharacterized protein n=1 Tax=Sphaerodactylus townsendi TaxID=933632 RepID=A0ACB8FJN1_9SAUR
MTVMDSTVAGSSHPTPALTWGPCKAAWDLPKARGPTGGGGEKPEMSAHERRDPAHPRDQCRGRGKPRDSPGENRGLGKRREKRGMAKLDVAVLQEGAGSSQGPWPTPERDRDQESPASMATSQARGTERQWSNDWRTVLIRARWGDDREKRRTVGSTGGGCVEGERMRDGGEAEPSREEGDGRGGRQQRRNQQTQGEVWKEGKTLQKRGEKGEGIGTASLSQSQAVGQEDSPL